MPNLWAHWISKNVIVFILCHVCGIANLIDFLYTTLQFMCRARFDFRKQQNWWHNFYSTSRQCKFAIKSKACPPENSAQINNWQAIEHSKHAFRAPSILFCLFGVFRLKTRSQEPLIFLGKIPNLIFMRHDSICEIQPSYPCSKLIINHSKMQLENLICNFSLCNYFNEFALFVQLHKMRI